MLTQLDVFALSRAMFNCGTASFISRYTIALLVFKHQYNILLSVLWNDL
jgi:hypothetical protein